MTVQLHNDPGELTADALRGYALDHSSKVKVHFDPTFVERSQPAAAGAVAIVSGGGSGHEPLHLGFVGEGMLDAAVPGKVFASPTASQVGAAIRSVDRGAGVLLIVKNYTGDILNFGLAAEDARDDGIPVEIVRVADDLASERTDGEGPGRRGTAGTVIVEKLCGAAARRGDGLAELAALGSSLSDRTRSLAVAFRSATLPGHAEPSFQLPDSSVEFGVGIHGERGSTRPFDGSGADLVESLVGPLVEALALAEGSEVIAVVNGLGGTPGLQLGAARYYLEQSFGSRGIGVARALTGSYVTALDMQGISITLLRVEDGDLELWDAPVNTVALSW